MFSYRIIYVRNFLPFTVSRHHKFAVVDHELLINGSFNWSRQAVLGNEENVVLMRNGGLVASFMEQFERLWIKFA